MKTTAKYLVPVIAFVLVVTEWGISKPAQASEQIQEIPVRLSADEADPEGGSTQAQFAGSIKPAETTMFDFENYAAGKLPSEWSQHYTGWGGTEWKIVETDGNKAMAQLYSDNPNNHFNVVVNNHITAKDMVLTARLKGVTGKHDRGGGFVWRFTDKNNYYVVRANPLEDNVVLYKVENGRRADLPLVGKGRTYGVDVPPLGNGWNTLKLVVKDELFTVFLNDKQLFKVQDKTFTKTGKVGFWTKADAVTYFDDFEIER